MSTLRIWPTQADPETGDVPGDCYEVVDTSGEGETLLISTLENCQAEYPSAVVER